MAVLRRNSTKVGMPYLHSVSDFGKQMLKTPFELWAASVNFLVPESRQDREILVGYVSLLRLYFVWHTMDQRDIEMDRENMDKENTHSDSHISSELLKKSYFWLNYFKMKGICGTSEKKLKIIIIKEYELSIIKKLNLSCGRLFIFLTRKFISFLEFQ